MPALESHLEVQYHGHRLKKRNFHGEITEEVGSYSKSGKDVRQTEQLAWFFHMNISIESKSGILRRGDLPSNRFLDWYILARLVINWPIPICCCWRRYDRSNRLSTLRCQHKCFQNMEWSVSAYSKRSIIASSLLSIPDIRSSYRIIRAIVKI